MDTTGAPYAHTATASAFTEIIGTLAGKFGAWNHILMRQDASALEVWGQGILQNSSATVRSMVSSGATLNFGIYHNSAFPYDGKLAEVGIWDAALSNDELMRLYKGISPASIQPSKLRGYWPLNDYGAAGIAKDRSPYNQTLTMGAAGSALLPDHPPVFFAPVTGYIPFEVEVGEEAPPDVAEETIDSATVRLSLRLPQLKRRYTPMPLQCISILLLVA